MTVEQGASHSTQARGVVLGEGDVRIWGMTAAERLRKTFLRAGLQPSSLNEASAWTGDVVLALADWVYDENLIKGLAGRTQAVLVGPGGRPVAAIVSAARAPAAAAALQAGDWEGALGDLARLEPGELAYNSQLRKREPPVLEPLRADNVRAVEARLFKGAYKGVTDFVTKYVWPVPARIVTRWCAQAKITPNQVTFASLLLVLATFWLFWRGQFGLGLVTAWGMTFLDTVDGKLARVTLTSSKLGNVFDHGIDLVHPPFWWWAWLVGVQQTAHPVAWPDAVLWVVVGGYVLQRAEEGVFLRLFKMQMHVWRPFDSFFRTITARRNPNLVLLTLSALAGRPDLGLLAVAVWTALCLLVHLVQILQGLATPRGKMASWLAG